MTERADGLPERAPKEKDASPNSSIDKAIKDLLKEVTDKSATIIPEEVTAKVRVVQTAIQWEKVKHHIKDEGEFDPESI
jgi:hypothetical protein